jgi:hypothetical protein
MTGNSGSIARNVQALVLPYPQIVDYHLMKSTYQKLNSEKKLPLGPN